MRFQLAAAFLALACPASAYRPLATEDAGVVGKGKLQLETSWDHARPYVGGREDVLLWVPSFGPTDRLELGVEIPYAVLRPLGGFRADGLGDILASFKASILKQEGLRPALTGKGFYKADNADPLRGLGTGYREYGGFAVLSGVHGHFQWNAMAGGDLTSGAPDHIGPAFHYGVSADYRVNRNAKTPLYLLTEVFGNTRHDRDSRFHPSTWMVGALYEFTPGLAADAGFGLGLNAASPTWRTTVGVTVTR